MEVPWLRFGRWLPWSLSRLVGDIRRPPHDIGSSGKMVWIRYILMTLLLTTGQRGCHLSYLGGKKGDRGVGNRRQGCSFSENQRGVGHTHITGWHP